MRSLLRDVFVIAIVYWLPGLIGCLDCVTVLVLLNDNATIATSSQVDGAVRFLLLVSFGLSSAESEFRAFLWFRGECVGAIHGNVILKTQSPVGLCSIPEGT